MVYGGFLGRVRLEDEEEVTVRRVRMVSPRSQQYVFYLLYFRS